jgi:hypothetical protein
MMRYIILKLNLVLQVLRLHTHEAVHFFSLGCGARFITS